MDVEQLRSPFQPWPCLRSSRRIYCVGDIHGRLDLLDGLLSRITADLTSAPTNELLFLFVGDYIDRGPSSRGVIDRLVALSEIVPTVFLRGNHEELFVDFLWQPLILPYWKTVGGYATLLSYGVVPSLQPSEQDCTAVAEALLAALPDRHRTFFESLRTIYTEDDYLFVHAGLRPGRPLEAQDERDLLWIRDVFLNSTQRHSHYVIHGHTPVPEPDLRPNRANIDTGAFATGRLSCLVIQGAERRLI